MHGIERYFAKIPRKDNNANSPENQVPTSTITAPSRQGIGTVDSGHATSKEPTQGPSAQPEVNNPASRDETSNTSQAENLTTPSKKRPTSSSTRTLIANEPAFLHFAIGKERIKKSKKGVATQATQTSLSLLNEHTISHLYMPD